MAQAILLTGQERRRRWSPADRLEILEAAFAPGANVSEVARRFDVSTGLLYTWRRQALSVEVTDGPAFVPATVVGAAGGGDVVAATIAVDFANGTKVRIASGAPCDLAAAVMRALK
ncbi:IS66-like element accessory protein TnpA [Rhizobium tumorigenes]|uniref:Transposase n=1 Tax=Rhizobium tumorigenes TaxID=2041385 RepID=A0AAF1KSL8_9HYPH|nr:transposase [Rhizobium tumorigenes]WFR98172.1 transposase [Rhizobium tumorigenes]WFS03550.1 transposase [Rhizobium tumorigenes]WFS03684.1 transposase [Rhizobium tumorigenes]